MYNTSDFIAELSKEVNKIVNPTYYEEAKTKDTVYPYGVISGIHITDLDDGDWTSFYIDLWADEKDPKATEQLEGLCDALRNGLTNKVIFVPGKFGAHIGFESQDDRTEAEFDLCHRRTSWSARIFFN
jgi:hypothetical protein